MKQQTKEQTLREIWAVWLHHSGHDETTEPFEDFKRFAQIEDVGNTYAQRVQDFISGYLSARIHHSNIDKYDRTTNRARGLHLKIAQARITNEQNQ